MLRLLPSLYTLVFLSGVCSREQDYHFDPKLLYTESGFSPRAVTLHPTFKDKDPPPPKGFHTWAGQTEDACKNGEDLSCTWSIKADESARFTIRNFEKQDFNCASGVDLLVWLRSHEGNIILSSPAIPDKDCLPGELAVNFKVQDPGAYDLTLVAADTKTISEGAHGTEARILPIRGDWKLWVRNPTDDVADEIRPVQQFHLPTKICTTVDQPTGRWIKCSAAGISASNCLRDGWVFVPDKCHHDVSHPSSILKRARKARPDITKPLWIVFLGSSIERGTVHAMVDIIGGVQFDTDKSKHLRTSIFGNGTRDEPGKGSSLKCWGWFDVQVGHLRLSYSDFRTPYMVDDNPPFLPTEEYGQQALKRLKEIIDEGPDVIVYGHSGGKIDNLMGTVVPAVASFPNWNGSLVFAPGKQRFLSGGIRAAYCGYHLYNYPAPPISDANVAQRTIRAKVKECGKLSCRQAQKKIVVGDEILMAWSFVFDMERPMSEKSASQHFHYYSRPGVKKPAALSSGMCNSDGIDGREVFGAVPEMAAQMYVAYALQLAGFRSDTGDSKTICNGRKEMHRNTSAPFIQTTVCADCPEVSCCPWVPAASNPLNVTTAINGDTVPELSMLTIKSCYKSPHGIHSESQQHDGDFESRKTARLWKYAP